MKPIILSIGTMYLDINCQDFPFGDGLLPEKEVVGKDYEFAPGLKCIVVPCEFTKTQDFSEADVVFKNLSDITDKIIKTI